jgi:3-oxoacyl-[acyl-carrier-protein] synthase-3
VARAIDEALRRAHVALGDVRKLLLHQANGKMDDAILQALYDLHDMMPPGGVMPMTISWLGNSSVATVPTLLDLILKRRMPEQAIEPGDIIVFASVGAGMHINAVVYRVPA